MRETPDVLVDSQIVEGGVLSLGAAIRVPVPADELWDKLTDLETMPSFISELKSSRRVSDEPLDGAGCRVEQVRGRFLPRPSIHTCQHGVARKVAS
jgi:hypothetical protein